MAAGAAVSSTINKAKTFLTQSFKRYFKKPWEITGPQSDPEYRHSVPAATEYRIFCPATTKEAAIIPCSDPETVFDIKYFARDQRRNRPPIRRYILKKEDVEKMMKENNFDVADFPPVYLTKQVEEDYNARGGGYQ
ncbi:hypothetical protein IFM89_011741 [Coptis chinensis]|uniref:Uncharacterized protein n=1 Tax=Coptis chinensis TaxID=261450 RepID=A0A835IXQ7_9MAGN|nr:hypothetical protein IFM89_011741 [Coptis chinensis]